MKKFSQQILIVTCDHFFNGVPEDRELLNQTYLEHLDLEFIELAHDKEHLYNRNINRTPEDNDWQDFWFSTTRYAPFFFLKEDSEYVLFLDSDEIIEGDKFLEWLKTEEYTKYDAIRWLQYYYFREAKFQCQQFQNGGLFAKKSALRPSFLMDTDDRCGIFHNIQGHKKENVSFMDSPMVHHYCWVKTKEECLLKAKYSGQHWERNWIELIEKEYASSFSGKDFDGRPYNTLETVYFDPFSVELNRKEVTQKIFPRVRKVTPKEIQRRELAFEFDVPLMMNDE